MTDKIKYNPEGQPRAPEVNLVEKVREFLNSTPEEIYKREAEAEKRYRMSKFTLIEGGKYGDPS